PEHEVTDQFRLGERRVLIALQRELRLDQRARDPGDDLNLLPGINVFRDVLGRDVQLGIKVRRPEVADRPLFYREVPDHEPDLDTVGSAERAERPVHAVDVAYLVDRKIP